MFMSLPGLMLLFTMLILIDGGIAYLTSVCTAQYESQSWYCEILISEVCRAQGVRFRSDQPVVTWTLKSCFLWIQSALVRVEGRRVVVVAC